MSDREQRAPSYGGEVSGERTGGSFDRPSPGRPRDSGQQDFAGTARFEIRRRIGSGGFGVVYEAFDRERRALVALKALERGDAATIYRFKQEFRALSDIVHPNLVQLYELHNEGERWFFTMELVEGGDAVAFVREGAGVDPAFAATQDAASPAISSLERAALARGRPTVSIDDAVALSGDRERVGSTSSAPPPPGHVARPRRHAGYDEARLRAVLRQLVEGLSALHAAGKLHRDVKPSNVLVGHDGRVVLVDFGLTMSFSESSYGTANLLAGTPAYMAPEQVSGGAPSPAWDWYAAGAVLFEALTGELPVDGTLVEILRRKQSFDPPAPSEICDDVAPDLDRLCVELLSRDPVARPTGSAVRERVGLSPRGEHPASVREGPFVGRVAERRAIQGALEAAVRESSAVIALIGGPSGVGKSALVRRAREDLRESAPEMVFLAGRCYEQESVPYKAIDSLIDPLSRHLRQLPVEVVDRLLPYDVSALARLFPVLEEVEAVRDAPHLIPHADPREARLQAFRALRQILARLAKRAPLCLFIDDLQWGDADSGALLVELLAPPDPPPVLFLATYRDEDREAPCLRALLAALPGLRGPSLRVVEIALANLAEGEATELRARAARDGRAGRPRDAAPRGERLAARAGRRRRPRVGRAAVLRERAGPLLPRSRSGHDAPGRGEAPPPIVSLDALVRERVAELPDPARRLLEVIAVAGRPVERRAAARAAQLDGDEPAAYAHLRGQRLVRLRESEGHEELETYHDRIREAVTAGLSAEARAACFQQLVAALEGTACDAETLAAYCVEAGDHARAAEHAATAAAEAARALAFDRAVRLYRLALDLRARIQGGDVAPLRALREGLGAVLIDAGHGAEAADVLLAAIPGAEPARALDLRRRAAEQLLISGHIDRGLAELRLVLAELHLRMPERPWRAMLGMTFWILLLVLRGLRFRPRQPEDIPADVLLRVDTYASVSKSLSLVDTVRGSYFAVRSLSVALAVGEHLRILRALALLVAYGGGAGGERPPWFLRKVSELARRMLEETDDPHCHALLRMCEGSSAFFRGSFRAAGEDLGRAIAILRGRCTGATWEIDTAEQLTLVCLAWQGAWKEIAARLPDLLASARAHGDLYGETSHTLGVGHIPALLADDPAAAEKTLRDALAAWSRQRFSVQHYYFTFALAEVHLYAERGRGALAARHLAGAWRELERSLLLLFQLPWVEMHFVRFRALVALAADDATPAGERRRGLSHARRIARKIGRISVPWVIGIAHLCRATLAAFEGQPRRRSRCSPRPRRRSRARIWRRTRRPATRRRGELTGGGEGRVLVDRADAWLIAQGVRDPARAVAMLTPGRWA